MAGLPPSIRNLIGLDGTGGTGDPGDSPQPDTSEQVIVSSLALIKMLRHGRAGVPMEVMGLMLGEFVDEFTIRVVDVFSMPQSGNTVSVEAVDAVYQAEMLDMLKRVGRNEMVVGWYHSHPGFGCWFSNTDINTQQSFEQLNNRAIGIVIDPIQSSNSNVVIDCFRLISSSTMLLGSFGDANPRQITTNIGHCAKPTITALIHGLNKHYHSLVINYQKNVIEQNLFVSILKPEWTSILKPELNKMADTVGLVTKSHEMRTLKPGEAPLAMTETAASILKIKKLVKLYKDEVKDDISLSSDEVMHKRVGKLNAKRQLENNVDALLNDTISTSFTATIASVVY